MEKREFREGDSDQFNERERVNGTLAFIATVSSILEEMPR
jgi:hypothetical protein